MDINVGKVIEVVVRNGRCRVDGLFRGVEVRLFLVEKVVVWEVER